MLVRFRKTILKLPLTLLCLWIGMVFADAANLDDFFSGSIVHTDIPETAVHKNSDDQISDISHSKSESSLPAFFNLLQNQIKPGKVIYDEDSPSLAPVLENTSEGVCLVLKESKLCRQSVSISKPLYLEFCTLLI